MSENTVPSCPRCERPGVGADTGGLLFACHACAVTFVPTGAGVVGLVQRTAHESSQMVVDRVPLGPAFTGRYQISRLVGSGGMGTVYLGRDRLSGREICVKFLYRIEDQELLVRFLREGKMLAQIQDPHVVELLEVGETHEFPYLVMEHVGGGTLRDRLQSRRGPPPAAQDLNATVDLGRPAGMPREEALDWMRQILEGLSACHQRGIVHRDLKPENVLVTAEGVAKLSDLGIGKDLADSGTLLTRTGEVMGTPTYVSPEQIRGQGVTFASDVYSFGVMAYELVTGSPPCVSFTLHDIIRWHKEEEAVPLVEKLPEVGRGLSDLVARCLAKDPAARPADAPACLEELSRIHEPRRAMARKRSRLAAVVALSLVALLGWHSRETVIEVTASPTARATPSHEGGTGSGPPYPVPASPDPAHDRWEAALSRVEQSEWNDQARTLQEHLEVVKLAEPFGDGRLAYSLSNLAYFYVDVGKPESARDALLRARKVLAEHPHPDLSPAIEEELANVYQMMGDVGEAEKLSRSTLAMAEGAGSAGNYPALASLLRLARTRAGEGRSEEARTLLARVSQDLLIQLAQDQFNAAYMLGEVADCYMKLGDDDAAEKTYRLQISAHERATGAESMATARALQSLASFYDLLGRSAEAEPLVLRAMQIFERLGGKKSFEVAGCQEILAQIALAQGNGEAAVRHADAALEIYEAGGHVQNVQIVGAVRAIRGQALAVQGKLPEALAELRRALEVQGNGQEYSDPGVAQVMGETARLELEVGDRERGRKLLERLVVVLEQQKHDHDVLFATIQQVGPLLEEVGDLDRALRVWQKGLEVGDVDIPGAQYDRMSFSFGVGRVLLQKGEVEKADEMVEKALKMWDEQVDRHLLPEAEIMGHLADLYREHGKLERVVGITERQHLVFVQNNGRMHSETVAARVQLGEARLAAGDVAGALREFEACLVDGAPAPGLAAEPKRWLREGYIEALNRAGRTDEARRIEGLR